MSNSSYHIDPTAIEGGTNVTITGTGASDNPYVISSSGGGGDPEWGDITGTLSAQTDLQTALNGKQASLGFTAENVANKATNLTSPDNTKYPTTQAVSAALGALTTSNVAEGSNLYFTAARAIASALTGFSSGAGTVAATDTILQAINKIVGNIALKQNKGTTTAFTADRSLTSSDDCNMLDQTNSLLTATVPTGLVSGFSCGVQIMDTFTFTPSMGVTLNGGTDPIIRTRADNGSMVAIVQKSTADDYEISGF